MGTDTRIELQSPSPNTRKLIYSSGFKRLSIYLEVAGFGHGDWAGLEEDLRTWEEPPGRPISEQEQQEIRRRIDAWSERRGLRVSLGPGLSEEEVLEEYRSSAWTVESLGESSFLTTPPKYTFWKRVKGLVAVFTGKAMP
jgi:hypothetical protein